MGLLPVLLSALMAILVLMLGTISAMNWAVGKMVGEKHALLEAIRDTGQVPDVWSAPFERRAAKLKDSPSRAAKMARLCERAQSIYLKRLDGLIRYVERSTLVENEGTRRELLETMARVRASWQEANDLTPGLRS